MKKGKYEINQQVVRIYSYIDALIVDFDEYYNFKDNKTPESMVLYFLSILMNDAEINFYKYLYRKEQTSRKHISAHAKFNRKQTTYWAWKIRWSAVDDVFLKELQELEDIFSNKLDKQKCRSQSLETLEKS